MTELHLTRARLRTTPGDTLSAIAPLLIPDDATKRASHSHHIVWLLFQDVPNTARDFLWRDEGAGKYMILSHRPPVDPHGLFALQTKPFQPELAAGDRLSFVLRANPVVASKPALGAAPGAPRMRGKKVDVVMNALHELPPTERAQKRDDIARVTGTAWLAAQGIKAGFELSGLPVVDGYTQVPVERRRGRPAGFSVLEFGGIITVSDPSLFLNKLAKGFGSAKAFGNGLMLIRRS